MYLGLISLHDSFANYEKADKFLAVLVLVGSVNIPIIKMSVEWWSTLHQSASITISDTPTIDPSMLYPLFGSMIGFLSVIIGVGGIGLLCMMVARAAGAGKLIAIDPSSYARNNALQLGATHAIDPVGSDSVRAVYDILPKGPDIVLEAAGTIEAVKLMTRLRRRGTKWNVFGITTNETFELEGGFTHFLEGRMDASFGTNPSAMQKSIRLMENHLVNPESIISHSFPLKNIHEAIAVMGQSERNKVMIHP